MTDALAAITGLVFGILLLDWLAVAYGWREIERFSKPVTMIMIILWTLTAAGWAVDYPLVLLLLGQGFGLAGDVFLLLRNRWFLWGLGAFLVGHLFYISILVLSLIRALKVLNTLHQWLWWVLLSIALWVVILAVFYRVIPPKSPKKVLPLSLWIPIQIYGWVLSILVILSILVVLIAPRTSMTRLLLPVGSFLFYISDSLLAYDRFKRSLPKSRIWVMSTYHLAQLCLAGGFLILLGFDWI